MWKLWRNKTGATQSLSVNMKFKSQHRITEATRDVNVYTVLSWDVTVGDGKIGEGTSCIQFMNGIPFIDFWWTGMVESRVREIVHVIAFNYGAKSIKRPI